MVSYCVIVFVFGLAWGWLTSWIAEQKGHKDSYWFVVGFFLGVIGVIIALLQTEKKN